MCEFIIKNEESPKVFVERGGELKLTHFPTPAPMHVPYSMYRKRIQAHRFDFFHPCSLTMRRNASASLLIFSPIIFENFLKSFLSASNLYWTTMKPSSTVLDCRRKMLVCIRESVTLRRYNLLAIVHCNLGATVAPCVEPVVVSSQHCTCTRRWNITLKTASKLF